ncbi:MAG: GNAT family N-acetyltransferase [Clostridia bacterium]|nr:GNAT family N-acetyltransferase [Clostridia bacterium]
MIIGVNREYKEDLISLWHNVFGDDREYIELLFPEKGNICNIFAILENDTVCSVLYLLDCTVDIDNNEFEGKYLYAAATDKKYRKRGFMALLIEEAQKYCKDNGFDFISLVPANEQLYSYYGKFGFESKMCRYKETKQITLCDATEISGEKYFAERKKRLKNTFNFSGDSVDYAVSCLKYSGLRFYKSSEDIIYLSDGDIKDSEEILKADASFHPSDAEKYGMIYPINCKLKALLKDNTVYMNIALD